MSVFSTWLSSEIEARGWDQRMAAQAFGVRESSVHNWLHQNRKPSVKNVLKIARGLHVPVEVVLSQAGYDGPSEAKRTPGAVELERAALLAALPQFAEIIDIVASKPPEQQAVYLKVIRRLLLDSPESPN